MKDLIELLADFQELNTNNFGVDEVAKLNAWSIAAHTAIEALQRENEALRKDAELLDFVEEHPHLSLRKYKNRWSFVGLTNYEYSTFGTAREAIQATLDAGKY
jgi:hypothetical protein